MNNQTKPKEYSYSEQITRAVDALCVLGKPTRVFMDGEDVTEYALRATDKSGRVGFDAYLRRVVVALVNYISPSFVVSRINGVVKLYLSSRRAAE